MNYNKSLTMKGQYGISFVGSVKFILIKKVNIAHIL